jgi:hypothetical protein
MSAVQYSEEYIRWLIDNIISFFISKFFLRQK